jgi:hypothetical protein
VAWTGVVQIAVVVAILIVLSAGAVAYRQYRAVRVIEHYGGRVETESNAPEWLRWAVGNDLMRAFDDVTQVELGGTNYVGRLNEIGSMREMRLLGLSGVRLDDADMVHLRGLTKMQWLFLDNTQITNDGLSCVNGMTTLRLLKLNNTGITDAGLLHLKEMRSLVEIELRGTKVTDTGVSELKLALPETRLRTDWRRY